MQSEVSIDYAMVKKMSHTHRTPYSLHMHRKVEAVATSTP